MCKEAALALRCAWLGVLLVETATGFIKLDEAHAPINGLLPSAPVEIPRSVSDGSSCQLVVFLVAAFALHGRRFMHEMPISASLWLPSSPSSPPSPPFHSGPPSRASLLPCKGKVMLSCVSLPRVLLASWKDAVLRRGWMLCASAVPHIPSCSLLIGIS